GYFLAACRPGADSANWAPTCGRHRLSGVVTRLLAPGLGFLHRHDICAFTQLSSVMHQLLHLGVQIFGLKPEDFLKIIRMHKTLRKGKGSSNVALSKAQRSLAS